MIGGFIMARLTALWSWASIYLSLAGAVAIALGLAFIKGRAEGKAAYVRQREQLRQASARKAEQITHELQNAPDARVDSRLGRWMRD